jgi:hypothetical protein
VLTRATARQMPILPPVSGQIDGQLRVLRCCQTGAKSTGLKTPSRGPLSHTSHSSMCSRHARRPWRRGWRVRRPGRGTEREFSFLTKMSARMATDGVLLHNRMIQITACYTSVCVCVQVDATHCRGARTKSLVYCVLMMDLLYYLSKKIKKGVQRSEVKMKRNRCIDCVVSQDKVYQCVVASPLFIQSLVTHELNQSVNEEI